MIPSREYSSAINSKMQIKKDVWLSLIFKKSEGNQIETGLLEPRFLWLSFSILVSSHSPVWLLECLPLTFKSVGIRNE
jgi:hypothetical protein